MLETLMTPVVLVGALAGFFGALRNFVFARERDAFWRGVTNLAVGALLAASAADYFIEPARPILAIPLGLVTGSVGGYLLDALTAVLPQAIADGAREFIMGWARRVGGGTKTGDP